MTGKDAGKGLTAGWGIRRKPCDSCRTAVASLFCRDDSVFLCYRCDSEAHATETIDCSHARVYLCEVCEHAPAHVTCKADAAALCDACDRDIHSANPLASRHERHPVAPFVDPPRQISSFPHYSEDIDDTELSSWILPESKIVDSNNYAFDVLEPYLDLGTGSYEPKFDAQDNSERVVPVRAKTTGEVLSPIIIDGVGGGGSGGGGSGGYGDSSDEFGRSKLFCYTSNSQSLSGSVSSSSVDLSVVPDSAQANGNCEAASNIAVPIGGADREARVLRYREKRKSRRFEKTIRYASRKAYAETRPRIKGRFAKRAQAEVEPEEDVAHVFHDSSEVLMTSGRYGVVPSF